MDRKVHVGVHDVQLPLTFQFISKSEKVRPKKLKIRKLFFILYKVQGIYFDFKGSLTRDFRRQVFFMNQCPPGPQVFHWSLFEFFAKIRGGIRECMFFTGVVDNGDKLFSGVNDTGERHRR